MKQYVNKLAVFLIAILFAAGCASDPNVESAKQYYVFQDFDNMIASAQEAINVNPENGDGYYYLAVGQVSLAARKDPSEREPLYEEARKNFEKAREIYKGQTIASTEAQNIDADIVASWGLEVNEAVDILNAEEPVPNAAQISVYHFINALTISPDSLIIKTYLADTYLGLGEYKKAEETLKDYIASGKATKDDFLIYANSKLGQDDLDGAFEVMTEIVAQHPDDMEIIEWIAFYHIESGDREQAVKTVTDLIETDPASLRYRLLYRDIFLEEMNSYIEDAEATLREVLTISAKVREAARDRGTSEAAVKALIAQEDEKFQEALELYKKSDELAVDIAQQFKEYVELNPDDEIAWREIGILYRARAVSYIDLRDATTDNEQAVKYDNRAKELLEATLPYFERVVELNDDDQQSWRVLFQIYSNLNMMDKAEAAMDKAGI